MQSHSIDLPIATDHHPVTASRSDSAKCLFKAKGSICVSIFDQWLLWSGSRPAVQTWNCQTLHKSLEITNAVHVTPQTLYTEITNAVHVTPQTLYTEITNAVHVTPQTLYTEITNAVHVTSLPGSLYVCLHFATAHVPILTN